MSLGYYGNLTRWSHGTDDLCVHQVDDGAVLHVVPVAVVQPLSQQLHGGLGAVGFPGGHIYIIHEHHLTTHGTGTHSW